MDVGQPATYSYIFLRNSGDEPLTLEAIEPVVAEGVDLVGAMVGTPSEDKDGPPTGDATFPPRYPYDLQDLAGFVMEPEAAVGPEAYQLSVGVQTDAEGVSSVRGFRVFLHGGWGGVHGEPASGDSSLCTEAGLRRWLEAV